MRCDAMRCDVVAVFVARHEERHEEEEEEEEEEGGTAAQQMFLKAPALSSCQLLVANRPDRHGRAAPVKDDTR
jgi:CO dehydrogenase/acetyl-CoA synthase beta subunit